MEFVRICAERICSYSAMYVLWKKKNLEIDTSKNELHTIKYNILAFVRILYIIMSCVFLPLKINILLYRYYTNNIYIYFLPLFVAKKKKTYNKGWRNFYIFFPIDTHTHLCALFAIINLYFPLILIVETSVRAQPGRL